MSAFYITTAIPYVNSDPHIGFALEVVVADAVARHRRARGDRVRFLTGTDDNSLKSVQAAETSGVPVADLVARYAARFESLREALNLSFDDFIRTSSDVRHLHGARKLWNACRAAGDVYKSVYRGLYCVGCERYIDPDELAGGLCPEHDAPPEQIEEENWFFRLSRYQDRLAHLIEDGQLRVVPETRRNEILSFIRSGLRDFSISRSAERSRGWGIPVPDDPTQVMYVWFDALGNYISALDYACDGTLFETYWKSSAQRVHVIGKDILRFHAAYWPGMLLAIGETLPTTIVTHGFVTSGGRKISKSLGNVVDPFALVEEYGTDAVRHFLLRHLRTTEDGDFTIERLRRAHNADLADQLGNLVSRVVAMVGRYCDGHVPRGTLADHRLRWLTGSLDQAVGEAVDRFALHEAMDRIWTLIEAANRHVVAQAPWALEGAPQETVLGDLCHVLRTAGRALAPFLPSTSAEVLCRVGEPGGSVRPGPPLFPRL